MASQLRSFEREARCASMLKNLYDRQQTVAEIQTLLAEVRLDLMLHERAARIAG